MDLTGSAFEHVIKPGIKKATKTVMETAKIVHGTLVEPFLRGVGKGIQHPR